MRPSLPSKLYSIYFCTNPTITCLADINLLISHMTTKSTSEFLCNFLAESQGFEPQVAFTTTVFKTAAFDRSANSPYKYLIVAKRFNFQQKKNNPNTRVRIVITWRRVRDSNPRKLALQRFSRPPLSTAQPTLQILSNN